MRNKLLYKLHSGRNPKFICYSVNTLRLIIPKDIFRLRLQGKLSSLSHREDKEYVEHHVDYYNKLSGTVQLPSFVPHLSEHKISKQKMYFFDTYQYTRWFSDQSQWDFCPGDVTFVPDYSSIVRSRPLTDDNVNSIVMKLDKVRHFIFVGDKKVFTGKKDTIVFRRRVKGEPSRKLFMEMYFHHPMCDLGDVSESATGPAEWHTEKKTINKHSDHKFIMVLEGISVAGNLKQVISSDSVAVMPRPTCETWFIEGTLIPNYHYIEMKPDFSDLEERLNYYTEHVDESLEIVRHVREYVSQFKDKRKESLVLLLVLGKYLRMTRQKS